MSQSNIPRELRTPSPEFQQASEIMGLHWWHWDDNRKHLTLAPALIRLLGYTEEEFDPSIPTLDKNIHPDDISENLERIRRVLKGELELYEMEYRVKDEQGEWQWFYNRGTVQERDPDGKPVAIGGIAMNMSGQFKHLMSKVEEKEKFEFIFRQTNEAIVVIELENGKPGRVLDANEAAGKLFERGSEGFQSVPREYRDDAILGERGELLKQVLKDGAGKIEYRLELPDNRERWIELTAHAFMRTGENLIIAIAKDITSDRETEAALRETERLYKTLVEAADDAIGLFTTEMEMILVNSAFYRNFGYTREEFMAEAPLGIVHPEDQQLLINTLPKVLEEGNLSLDFRVLHKSGEIRYVSSKSVVIRGDRGEGDLILTIIRDTTDRMKAIEELEQAKEQAEESDQLKSAFLANMSHEIRTPMNSIVGFSNLLANQGITEEARSLYVNRIVRNSELLLTLISDIIDLAKIESGQLPIIYGKQNVASLISDLEQHARDECERLGKSGIRIETVGQEHDCIMETDVIRLAQVMKNLVNNAVKFTETGMITIGCRMAESGQHVHFFVEDSGIGISESDFVLIFDQFRQVDSSNTRKFGGTGLGLAISRNLVRMMGGRIWVESTMGHGALFNVELPLASPRGQEPEQTPDLEPEEHVEPAQNLRIMVVEDEEDSLELFSEILERMGHQVSGVSSGYEALKVMADSSAFDLVFMDVQMPVLSGTETMKILKERYGGIRVVAQSAHALVGDKARFLDEGFDAYLPKPFKSEQLSGILLSLFGN